MPQQSFGLALTIDASQAEAGAKRMTAALTAVKEAVKNLSRDSIGAFTALNAIDPKFDTSSLRTATTESTRLNTAVGGIGGASAKAEADLRKLAVSSASALRTSENAAQRLTLRLEDVGNTKGVAQITSQLETLRTALGAAPDLLSIREAKSEYDNLQSSLNRASIAAHTEKFAVTEAAQAEKVAAQAALQLAATTEALKLEFVEGYSAAQKLAAALARVAEAEKLGVLSASAASAARAKATQSFAVMAPALERTAGGARNAAYEAKLVAQQLSQVAQQTMVTGQFVQALAIQLPDIGLAFGGVGIAAGVLAGIALPLVVEWFGKSGEAAKSAEDRLKD
jgi:hypothetical protein